MIRLNIAINKPQIRPNLNAISHRINTMANYITIEIDHKIVAKRSVLDYDCRRIECGIK